MWPPTLDEPLDDQAVLIRGGLMEIVTLRHAIETCRALRGFYGLSFFGDNGLSVDETARHAKLPNGRIRVSEVGRLRIVGHEPYRSGEYPHLTVRFEVSPTDEDLAELVEAFDADIPNPHISR